MSSRSTTEDTVSLVLSTRPVASTKLKFSKVGPKKLKPTQVNCVTTLLPATCGSLDAPTGSGKSVSIMVLADLRLRADLKRLAVICVPQTQIADNFTSIQYQWGADTNNLTTRKFCGEGAEVVKRERVSELQKWLKAEHATYSSYRCAVVSHQGLVILWNRLSAEERVNLFQNVDLYIDEAHHVDGALNISEANCLGSIVKTAVARITFASVTLVTATMFRGDVSPLLSPEELSEFTRWQLTWEDNFSEMKWLRNFDMKYVFGENWDETITHVITSACRKDIVYLPAVQSKLGALAGGKYEGVRKVIESYRLSLGKDATVTYTSEGVHIISSSDGTQTLKVLDLVSEKDRSKKKAYFNRMRAVTDTEPALGKDMLDVVITLNMMKEGADWIWAERIVLMGKRDSFVDQLQILGRLLRDAPGKTRVEIANVLLRPYDVTDLQAKVNHQVNNILRAMILETIIAPTRLLLPGVGRRSGERRDWLAEVFPDVSDRVRILEKSVDWLYSAPQSIADEETFEDSFCAALDVIVQSYSGSKLDPDTQASVVRTIKRMIIEPVENVQKTDDLDLVISTKVGSFTSLTARCGLVTLQMLKAHLGVKSSFASYQEAQTLCRALGVKSQRHYHKLWKEGKLPNCPSGPHTTYKNAGWVSWSHFLRNEHCTRRVHVGEFLSYEEAKKLVQPFNFKSSRAYMQSVREGALPGCPVAPDSFYVADVWEGWSTFLRDEKARISIVPLTYDNAVSLIRRFNFKSEGQYIAAVNNGLLPGCPRNPDYTYKNKGWNGWPNFLRQESSVAKVTCTFEEAVTFVRNLKLTSIAEYKRACRSGKLPGIPSHPDRKYKNSGWVSWSHFLGSTVKTPRTVISYQEATKLIHPLMLKSKAEYKAYASNNPNSGLPLRPDNTYKNSGWSGLANFLGMTNADAKSPSKNVVAKSSQVGFSVNRYSTRPASIR